MGAPDLPPGWSYNPSAWSERLPVLALALTGFGIASYLGLYQLGVVSVVWEPLFQEGSIRILKESSIAHFLPIPDAVLGAVVYLLDAAAGVAGGRVRLADHALDRPVARAGRRRIGFGRHFARCAPTGALSRVLHVVFGLRRLLDPHGRICDGGSPGNPAISQARTRRRALGVARVVGEINRARSEQFNRHRLVRQRRTSRGRPGCECCIGYLVDGRPRRTRRHRQCPHERSRGWSGGGRLRDRRPP